MTKDERFSLIQEAAQNLRRAANALNDAAVFVAYANETESSQYLRHALAFVEYLRKTDLLAIGGLIKKADASLADFETMENRK